jgi:nucleotide-binding universal stress UspA family protein
MKRDILIPFDGSKNAGEALHLAITMAKSLQEKVIVLNIQPAFRTPNVQRFFNDEAIREYQEQQFHEVTAPIEQVLKDSGIEFEIKLGLGDAKEQILRQANPTGSDQPGCSMSGVRMIVMGSRGLNPVVGGILGSVSYGVVNAATCPVTIVPYSCE